MKKYQRSLTIQVSPAEMIDRLTILYIKSKKLTDPVKLKNVKQEIANIEYSIDGFVFESSYWDKLYTVNERIWEAEDAIREKENKQEFDSEFIRLARSIYQLNDERFRLKREMNVAHESTIVEEKSYK